MEDEYAIPENPLLLNFMGVVLLFIFLNHIISGCFILRKEVEPVSEKEDEKENNLPSIVKYEDKYKEKYGKLEDRELSTEYVERLKNSILLETTPLGNVLLFYDHSRETFTYYSDNTIPYRFLETVSRKYVTQNNCKSLYVNMEEELGAVEEKKKLVSEKKEKQLDEPEKKSVFAKLKSYNKNTGLQSSAKPGPKPGPEKNTSFDNSIVKEKANRYSYEGKMANYSFLKKVDRKVVDKQYSISFAEFKKLYASSFIEK